MNPHNREAMQILHEIGSRSHKGNSDTCSEIIVAKDGLRVLIFQAPQDGDNLPSGSLVALIHKGELVDLLVRSEKVHYENWHEKWHVVTLPNVVDLWNQSERRRSFIPSDGSPLTVVYETHHYDGKTVMISYRVTAKGFEKIED
jgi:hypothetical protein